MPRILSDEEDSERDEVDLAKFLSSAAQNLKNKPPVRAEGYVSWVYGSQDFLVRRHLN